MREGDGLRGRGESLVAVAETGGSVETSEGDINRYFGGVKGVAMTEIR